MVMLDDKRRKWRRGLAAGENDLRAENDHQDDRLDDEIPPRLHSPTLSLRIAYFPASLQGRSEAGKPMRLRRIASSTPAATARPLSERRDGSTCRPRGSTSPTLTPAWTGTPSASRPRRSPAMGALTRVPSTSPTVSPGRTSSPIRH